MSLRPVPAREAKLALFCQLLVETLAGAQALKNGKLRAMRAARIFPVARLSFARDGLRGPGAVLTSLGLALLVGLADHASGGAYRLGLLYCVPLALASWSSGRIAGIAVAAVSLTSWQLVRGDVLETAVAAALCAVLVGVMARLR